MTKCGRGKYPNSLKNLTRVTYTLDDGFFSQDGYVQGYYAGLLAADGCVTGSNVSWAAQRQDRCLLEDFREAISFSGPIHDYLSHGYPQSYIAFTSSQVVSDLHSRYNITPRKSLTLGAPEIPDISTRNGFVKGFIDGDGSIGVYNDNKMQLSVCGTESMTNFIGAEWGRVSGVLVPPPRKVKNKNVWVVELRKEKARKVFSYYYHQPLGLLRKWSKDKIDLCDNWRWHSKKYLKRLDQYEFIANRLDNHTILEISQELGCTYQNVWYIVTKSDTFQHFLSTRHEGVGDFDES